MEERPVFQTALINCVANNSPAKRFMPAVNGTVHLFSAGTARPVRTPLRGRSRGSQPRQQLRSKARLPKKTRRPAPEVWFRIHPARMRYSSTDCWKSLPGRWINACPVG